MGKEQPEYRNSSRFLDERTIEMSEDIQLSNINVSRETQLSYTKWGELTNVHPMLIYLRIRNGWKPEYAVQIPKGLTIEDWQREQRIKQLQSFIRWITFL